jgi:hypothetical protein
MIRALIGYGLRFTCEGTVRIGYMGTKDALSEESEMRLQEIKDTVLPKIQFGCGEKRRGVVP